MNEKNGGRQAAAPSERTDGVQRPRAAEGVGPYGLSYRGGAEPAGGASPSPTRENPGTAKPFWSLRQALNRDGVLQLYIYGDVEGDWYDWWNDREIESETSADFFRAELAKYPEAREIEIFINSYGGEVFEGTAIYNQLRRHPARKTVYVDGFACSIASVIAMAGDEIIMPRNTMMMIHNMWMGAVGNAQQLRKAADDLDVINAAGRQAYLLKAGDKLSEEKLSELMDAETWLTAAQCIELGLADRFADEDADLSGAAALLQRVNTSLEQQVERNRAITARARECSFESSAVSREEPTAADGEDPNPVPEREPEEKDEKPEAEADAPGLMAFLAGVQF